MEEGDDNAAHDGNGADLSDTPYKFWNRLS